MRVERRETSSFSIGTPIATHQGLAAQRRIASSSGLFLEASSAICVPAVEQLVRDARLGALSRVVCLSTSTGLKDIGAAARHLPDVPVIEPELTSLERLLGHAAEGR